MAKSKMVKLIPHILKDHTLSIESKMVLLSIVENRFEETSLRTCAIALRVADKTFKSALDNLLELGLIKKKLEKNSTSRAVKKYCVQEERIENFLSPCLTHCEEGNSPIGLELGCFVKEMFCYQPQKPRSNRDRKSELLPINRMLFAIFLAHSDELGIVDNLSKAELKKLTGYSADKLNSQLKKLVQFGVLVVRASGLSKSLLVGKVKSIYFLQLTHDAFKRYEYELVQYKYVFLGMNRSVFINSIGE